jgi:hypothetical protein
MRAKELTLYRPRKAAGTLLIVACSASKREGQGALPALSLYDGVNFRVIRKFLDEQGWPPGLNIKVLSAKYGLLDATDLIETYDERLTPTKAATIQKDVVKQLAQAGRFQSVFVNLGKDYLPAIEGIEQLFSGCTIKYATGGIGSKMKEMKRWLARLTNRTASLPGRRSKRSYLYFFPDWDDYVSAPFIPECEELNRPVRQTRKYAHEIFGAHETPYDGILVSLAQIYTGKGALSRLDQDTGNRSDLRKAMKIPARILLLGDCGAFSYSSEPVPPFSPAEAARLYERFGFDAGASVDHIPLPEIVEEDRHGKQVRRRLSRDEQRSRMNLTTENAEQFLAACRRNRHSFVPFGVVQGIDVASYVESVNKYLDMGYRHIALGGLVPRADSDILDICCAVRTAIQSRTRTKRENVWLHLLGVLRPKLQPLFKQLGVSSFDSASYLRKAWLRSDQNYLAADGASWYSTIRVPISTTIRMVEAAEEQHISGDDLRRMESACLSALHAFDGSSKSRKAVIESVNAYGPLLERRGEDNHFIEKHRTLLTDQPWEKCRCAVCREVGIEVVVFRGAGRNKRRGLHNTWVFYHKILHGRKKAGDER